MTSYTANMKSLTFILISYLLFEKCCTVFLTRQKQTKLQKTIKGSKGSRITVKILHLRSCSTHNVAQSKFIKSFIRKNKFLSNYSLPEARFNQYAVGCLVPRYTQIQQETYVRKEIIQLKILTRKVFYAMYFHQVTAKCIQNFKKSIPINFTILISVYVGT